MKTKTKQTEAQEIAQQVLRMEISRIIRLIIKTFEEHKIIVGFNESLALAEFFISTNNRFRKKDEAIITFIKIKKNRRKK